MATLIRIYKDRISIRSGLAKEQATRKGEKFEKKNEGSPLWQVVDGDVAGDQKQDIWLLAMGESIPPGHTRIRLTGKAILHPAPDVHPFGRIEPVSFSFVKGNEGERHARMVRLTEQLRLKGGV